MPGEPADQGGLKPNDVVVALDNTRLETPRDLQRVVSSTPVGTKVTLRVLREGREQALEVTVGLYKDPEAAKEAAK
jgi:serine protease Do